MQIAILIIVSFILLFAMASYNVLTECKLALRMIFTEMRKINDFIDSKK